MKDEHSFWLPISLTEKTSPFSWRLKFLYHRTDAHQHQALLYFAASCVNYSTSYVDSFGSFFSLICFYNSVRYRGNLLGVGSWTLHMATNIKFSSFTAFIRLYSLFVIFFKVLVFMPALLILADKWDFVRSSILILKLKLVHFSLVVLRPFEVNSGRCKAIYLISLWISSLRAFLFFFLSLFFLVYTCPTLFNHQLALMWTACTHWMPRCPNF